LHTHASRLPARATTVATALLTCVAPALWFGAWHSPAEAATTTTTAARSVTGWQPSLTEEFDSISTSRWNVRTNEAHPNEESYLLARNVSVDAGALRIQAKKESVGGKRYTSGYVDSKGKYTLPNYFRAEIRAKVPLEEGMWAAPLWFRPADGSGGEIDLAETYGYDLEKFGEYRVHHTVHNAYGSGHQTDQKQQRFPGDPLAWHTYVIEKTPGKIEMFVDGQRTGLWQQGDPTWFNSYFESGKKWALILNLQVGGHRGSPSSATDWAADKTALKIDYLRTWTRG
jgi:beta-glucanase (GH16 family)